MSDRSPKHVSEAEFSANPAKFLSEVRGGVQIVLDDATGKRVAVIGLNGHEPFDWRDGHLDALLSGESEAGSTTADGNSWLR